MRLIIGKLYEIQLCSLAFSSVFRLFFDPAGIAAIFGNVGTLLAARQPGRDLVEKLDAYLTIKEAAEFLGVSTNTLRNWGRDGKVPMHRNPINGYRLFKIDDLKKLLGEIEQSRRASDVKRKAK